MSAISGANNVLQISPPAESAAGKPAKPSHEGLSFGDLLDVINPLQHIPVVSTLYRKLTGDEMSPTAEIAGGALFGGIIGAVGSIADVLFTQATGRNFGDTVYAWLGFEDKNPPVQLAKDTPPAAGAILNPAEPSDTPRKVAATQIPAAGIPVARIPVAQTQPIAPQTVIAPSQGRAPIQTIRPAAFVAPTRVQPAAPAPVSKFMENLIKQNIDPATAARAEFAYRSALGLTIEPMALPAPGF